MATLGTASLITSLIGTGVSAYASFSAANAQAKVDERNAKAAQQNAKNSAAEEAESARRARDNNRREIARRRARLAASGVNIEGSPLLNLAETSGALELGVQDAFRAGSVNQARLLGQSDLLQFNARQNRNAGQIGARATLLSGAASAAGSFYDLRPT